MGEVTGGGHWVAFQDGELCAGRQERRSRALLHLIGREGVLRLRRLRRNERSQGKYDSEKR
jgi:hypothetical protein